MSAGKTPNLMVREGMSGAFIDSLCKMPSVRVLNSDAISKLERINTVVIVGSSCAGKSTLIQAVKAKRHLLSAPIEIPLRYVTRTSRDNEVLSENLFVTPGAFEDLVRNGEIVFHWTKSVGSTQRYGFGPCPKEAIIVYSANNALFLDPNRVVPEGLFATTLVCGVFAPDEVRKSRLEIRSKDLVRSNPEEAQLRISHSIDSVMSQLHLIIDNYGGFEALALYDAVSIVSGLAKTSRAAL